MISYQKSHSLLFASIAITLAGWSPAPATAQEAEETAVIEEVLVTARKREESVLDVPVSLTAISGEEMERLGRRSIADIAAFVPGLNINSDSVLRAFVAIRGIGTALQLNQQPGVGLFQDGIYVPYTSYVNNPTLDIERIEVLRGPQGTLYGKNTLAGAINVITREPGDEFESMFTGGWGAENDSYEYGARISGPISGENLKGRIAFNQRRSDGYWENLLTGEDAFPDDSDHLTGTLYWTPTDATKLTVNGYWLDLTGGGTNYSSVDSTTDYRSNINMNVTALADIEYSGANAKFEMAWPGLNTRFTAIAAYDSRETDADGDGDFTFLDIVRTSAHEEFDTTTVELRFDTEFTDTFSTLFGLFASTEETDTVGIANIVPFGLVTTTVSNLEADTYSAFGTAIWRVAPEWELAFGARWDDEERTLNSEVSNNLVPGVVIPDPERTQDFSDTGPRVSLTHFLSDSTTVYGAIAKGYRGGGFNGAAAPPEFQQFDSDTVWTYEIGAKSTFAGGRAYIAGAVYYNDYTDFVGPNALVVAPGGNLVAVVLNSGDVESYGLELEGSALLNDNWSVGASVALMHARVTDDSGWVAVTGTPFASDRLLFQPDWQYSLNSDYRFTIGSAEFNWNLNASGKGKRTAASNDPVEVSWLESYNLVGTAISWYADPFEVTAFANNLFDEDYYESYIDGSVLGSLGLPPLNLGILGAPANYGLRLQFKF